MGMGYVITHVPSGLPLSWLLGLLNLLNVSFHFNSILYSHDNPTHTIGNQITCMRRRRATLMHDHIKCVMHLRRATLMHDYIICDAFVWHHEEYESLAQYPSYNTKMDVFLFSMLALHLVSQVWPVPTEAVRITPNRKLLSISDVDPRKAQFDLMGSDHCVRELMLQYLQNDSGQRPEISNWVCRIFAPCKTKSSNLALLIDSLVPRPFSYGK